MLCPEVFNSVSEVFKGRGGSLKALNTPSSRTREALQYLQRMLSRLSLRLCAVDDKKIPVRTDQLARGPCSEERGRARKTGRKASASRQDYVLQYDRSLPSLPKYNRVVSIL